MATNQRGGSQGPERGEGPRRRTDRRQLMLGLTAGGSAVAGAMLAAGLGPGARAAEHEEPLAGVWLVDFRRPESPRPDRDELVTSFTVDGGVTVAAEPEIVDTAGVRQHQTIGLGHWERTGTRTFTYAYMLSRRGLERSDLLEHIVVRVTLTVSEPGNQFAGTFMRETLDPDDRVVNTREGTVTGRRFLP